MANEQSGAAARDIPVPPAGGSWTFDEAKWEWVSNDTVPASAPAPDAVAEVDQAATHTPEQEQ